MRPSHSAPITRPYLVKGRRKKDGTYPAPQRRWHLEVRPRASGGQRPEVLLSKGGFRHQKDALAYYQEWLRQDPRRGGEHLRARPLAAMGRAAELKASSAPRTVTSSRRSSLPTSTGGCARSHPRYLTNVVYPALLDHGGHDGRSLSRRRCSTTRRCCPAG